MCVVKADAYGHGLAECARLLREDGTGWFGVTCVEEAVALRGICPEARILVMSGVWRGEAEAAIEHRLTPAVWEPFHLEWLDKAARRQGLGASEFPVHLEIDTGMSRQGVGLADLKALLERFEAGSPLRVEAVMTHFHSAGDRKATTGQIREFGAAVDAICKRGLPPDFLSAGSSGSTLQQDTEVVTELAERIGARRMLRAGIALYGYAPGGGVSDGREKTALEPVLAWKTRVISLREIPVGTTVGYDATFRAQRTTRLALLPVGYADGLNRLLSGDPRKPGSVLVRGQRAPIAGRVSMDQTTVDVTDIAGVEIGDEVALIGEQGAERITADDMAALTSTISYEVLCDIGARVPRRMVE